MNLVTGPHSEYQLFGYNPIADAVTEELDALNFNAAAVVKYVFDQEKLPAQVYEARKFIPYIKLRSVTPNDFRLGNTWRNQAYSAISGQHFLDAMLYFKKVCELPNSSESDWHNLLTLAQNHYQQIVPQLCERILKYVNDNVLKNRAKTLLNNRGTTVQAY